MSSFSTTLYCGISISKNDLKMTVNMKHTRRYCEINRKRMHSVLDTITALECLQQHQNYSMKTINLMNKVVEPSELVNFISLTN